MGNAATAGTAAGDRAFTRYGTIPGADSEAGVPGPVYPAWVAARDEPLPGYRRSRIECVRAGVRSINDVYGMRMARVNITIPDELLEHARTAGLNVSRLAAAALMEELDRRAKIAALDAYLAEMDAEFGPVPDAERQEAAAWADGLVAGRPTTKRTSSGARRARSA